ncbi:MAG: hypothetical protein QW757_01690 [Candidatus Woesearchaeota archaeon]
MDIIFTPIWFYGRDILIDSISVVVLMLIFYFVIKNYFLNKNKRYLLLGISFFLLSLSFLIKMILNFIIYNNLIQTKISGYAIFDYEKIASIENYLFISFFILRLITLTSLFILYLIYIKQQKSNILLLFSLLLINLYYSIESHFAFHFISFLILFLISLKLYEVYRKNNFSKTKLLAISFFIISLSQFFFLFIEIESLIYVIAELIQLVGYLILLFTYIMVLKDGKKNKNRYNN